MRLNFQPYSHEQLQQIAENKLSSSAKFDRDALQFASRLEDFPTGTVGNKKTEKKRKICYCQENEWR